MSEMPGLWETVKSFYNEKFGASPELVDIASVFDILKMCAAGASNGVISTFLNEHEQSVMETVDAYLGHMGWEVNLIFNPKRIYDGLDTKDIESFRDVVVTNYGFHHPKLIDDAYNTCVIVSKLERILNESWV